MGTVTFAEDGDEAALLYTVTVYDEKYYKDKAANEGYSYSPSSRSLLITSLLI